MYHVFFHLCCQNTVRRQGSLFLSESQAAVRLNATVHHGNSARGGVCLHADVWWQLVTMGQNKRFATLKGSRVALLEWSMLSYPFCILKKEPSQDTYLPPTTAPS